MSLIKNNDDNNFYPVSIPEVDWQCEWLWSSHRGCPFDCLYCSSKRFNVRFGGDPAVPRRLKGEWIKDGEIEVIKYHPFREGGVFVNPYIDIFGLPKEDIISVLQVCNWSHGNQFIFQTKKPELYFDYIDLIPERSWLGTTIEETGTVAEYYKISKAPTTYQRYLAMAKIPDEFNKFVTIEPAMKMDNRYMVSWIKEIKPDLIFIGCDTGKNNLPEPTRDELIELIEQLKEITTVHVKSNAQRIIGDIDSYDWFKAIDMKGE